ncbi:RHS repeat-associated core domain-containing protein [Pseudomonas poae]|uniref:RHS repeat-associated core domain-containing protein n=1 Tax=Pseudomonas poae TaxID=200451 RepID=A0A7M1KN21_9PSED|nr:RHS repeat-associated core domain-containing protein [Pseudomonas poae]QOQ77731.1 RHS repeat-associated core domain-containing protein [Pseudomonas poae]
MDHNPMGMDPVDSENDPIFNATTQKRNVVDPRTGLFEAYFRLSSITANNGNGPVIDLSLYNTPVVNNKAALGDGNFYAMTHYDRTHKKLTLHTGEVLELFPDVRLKHPAVIVTWLDTRGERLTVLTKGGRKETLARMKDTDFYLPEYLTTDGYNSVSFTWRKREQQINGKSYFQVLLASIQEEPGRTLLKVEYTPALPDTTPAVELVKFIFWPNDAAKILTYTLNIKDYALQSVSLGDDIQTTLEYDEHPTCGWLLKKIKTFDGLEETVEYKDNGLKFKDNPKLSDLPCVNTHTLTPTGGGTPVITTYIYKLDDDDAYRTTMSEGVPAIRTTVYQYDKDHNVKSETVTQGAAETKKEYDTKLVNSALTQLNITTTYKKANRSRAEKIANELLTGAALRSNEQNDLFTKIEYFNVDKGYLDSLMDDIFNASKKDPGDRPQPQWRNKDAGSDFDFAYVSAEVLRIPPDLLKKLLPDLPLLRNRNFDVQQLKAHSYTTVPGMSQGKLRSTLQVNLASNDLTRKFADAALTGKEYTYYLEDGFRKGRPKSIRQSTLKNSTLEPTVIEPLRTFEYALGGSGNTELTTTTTDTDDQGNQRTASETLSTLNGSLIRQVDTDGNRTEYTYNPFGQLATLTVCAQSPTYRQVTTYTYPAPGQVQITEPNGETRLSQYDGRDRLVSEYLIEGDQQKLTKTVSYDRIGRELRTTFYDYLSYSLSVSHWQENKYDDWNQVCGITYSDGRQDFDFYDPVALTRTQWTGKATDKHATVTSFNTDKTIKKIEWKGEDGKVYQTQTASYSHFKLVTRLHTDGELGETTIDYTYDGSGRLLSEKHSEKAKGLLAPSLVYTYYYTYPKQWLLREAEQVDIEFDGKRQRLGKRTFDSWGRVTSMTRGTCTETFTYTGASKVPTSTETAEGSVLQHEYIKELGNRLAKTRTANAGEQKSFTYAYGTQGIATASEGEHLLEYTHDRYLHVTQQRVGPQPDQTKEVLSNYSMGGRANERTDTLGNRTVFQYNVTGQRIAADSRYFRSDHSYDEQGRLRLETIKGSLSRNDPTISFAANYTYDSQHRETSRQFTLSGKVDLTLASTYYADDKLKSVQLKQGSTVLGSRSLTYTPGGRLKACTTTGVWRPKTPKNKDIDKQEFTYDALGNVTTCITTFGTEKNTATYTYDGLNGLRLKTLKNDHADYPTALATLSYDLAGQMTQDHTGKKYTYDWLGRLTQAGSTRYSYDPSDRLMTREQDGEQTQLIYDGLNVCGEYSLGSDDAYRNLNPGSSGCTVQQIKRSGVVRTLFELRDANGTVCVSYDMSAETFKHHAYTAWGEHFSDEPDSMLGFNGEYRDAATGQSPLGMGYRWYDPQKMSFEKMDTLSPHGDGGPNMYGYCANGDPVNYQDPTGHQDVQAQWTAVYGGTQPQALGFGPGPAGAVISAIIWGGLGILTTFLSGGLAFPLLASLAALSLGAALGSALTSESNPELSKTLGWISLGAGALGGLASLAGKTATLSLYLARTALAAARNLVGKAVPIATIALRHLGQLNGLGRLSLKARFLKDIGFNANALTFKEVIKSFGAAEINTIIFVLTGSFGNANTFEPGPLRVTNTLLSDLTWGPWGQFMKIWSNVRR